jgi:imidazolonepropionase-like amidohydrolase
MTWERAPENPSLMAQAGLAVALTTSRLDKRSQFWEQVRKLKTDWLPMLTTTPAKILGLEGLGKVERGARAHLSVWTAPPDSKKAKLLDLWIDGRRHEINRRPPPDLDGEWSLGNDTLVVDGKKATLGKAKSSRFSQRGPRVDFVIGETTYSGFVNGEEMGGDAEGPDGRFRWHATRTERKERADVRKASVKDVAEEPGARYPFGPYSIEGPPAQPDLLIVKGATVWTSGPQGVIENGEIEVRKGKITYVGKARDMAHVATAIVIDASGKHVTPGIIDCHSHTGISHGINDSGQAITAEVRIGDVTDPDSISWYRQLASGVTTVNNLHGSANPIGGQSQTNKVRWGALHPDDMHFEGAMPGIKFALGENVKQSNWGDEHKTRYPQTRMGVETLIRDRFTAAREYIKGHDKVDLELEALAEILQGKRLIHCHSYRQDEILMLCRVAQEFGFRIGTFQHCLEGYKVAEAIKEHAIGASAFSDWWAYKVEVQDAIPFNGAIMHDVGVVVSFNSDSDDLARRLNVEAAKAVKYGNVPRSEAFKFVTLNAAIQLGIGDRVGSLEKGKDADFAIWSGDPMSTYTICEHTFVDGREYFSLEQDRKHRAENAKERARIIRKLLELEPEKGKDKRPRAMQKWWIERFQANDCGVCGVEEQR